MLKLSNVKSLTLISAMAISANAWSYGIGYSTFPLQTEEKMLSTEVTNTISEGSGAGLQTRFTYKSNRRTVIDAGIGVSGGQRTGRIFINADYELLPDYMSQPKLSLKTGFQNSKEFGIRKNIFKIAPTLSKGLSFWGKEAFPYASIPISLDLDSSSKTYETLMNVAVGITGKLPVQGYTHITANAELSLNLKDSYSGVIVGLSYPIN